MFQASTLAGLVGFYSQCDWEGNYTGVGGGEHRINVVCWFDEA